MSWSAAGSAEESSGSGSATGGTSSGQASASGGQSGGSATTGGSASSEDASSGSAAASDAGIYVTPLVRKLASEAGLQLNEIAGTGVGGRIRKQDVLEAASAREAAAKAVCAACPVIEQCRKHSLKVREPYGVWGGLTEDDREAIYAEQRGRVLRIAS